MKLCSAALRFLNRRPVRRGSASMCGRTRYSPAASLNRRRSGVATTGRGTHRNAKSEGIRGAAEAELAKADGADRSSWVKVTNITFDTEWPEPAPMRRVGRVARAGQRGRALQQCCGRSGSASQARSLKLSAAMPPPDWAGGREELASLTSKLDSLYSTHTVPYQGRTLTRAEAADLLLRSTDPVELKALWEGVRANLPALRVPYVRSVVLANEGARGLGFNDVGEMWRAGYDIPSDAFASLVDRLWTQVQPLYESLLCYMRARMSERYGAAEQPRTGPIQHHLVGTGWDNAEGIYFPKTEGGYDLTKLPASRRAMIRSRWSRPRRTSTSRSVLIPSRRPSINDVCAPGVTATSAAGRTPGRSMAKTMCAYRAASLLMPRTSIQCITKSGMWSISVPTRSSRDCSELAPMKDSMKRLVTSSRYRRRRQPICISSACSSPCPELRPTSRSC